MARRLGKPDIARNHRLENQLAQTFADILGHLVGQAIAPIEHGESDTDDVEPRVKALLNPFDRLEQLAEPFQREKFALERNEQRIGGAQRVQRQQAERRRAVDEADVMPAMLRELLAQFCRAILDRYELDLSPAQILCRRDHIEPGNACRNHRLGDGVIVDEQVIARDFARPRTDAEPGRGIALRVEVDQERAPSGRGHRSRDVDRGGGLPHPAFLVGYGYRQHDRVLLRRSNQCGGARRIRHLQ
ncbi:hypothetical protein EH32_10240 [Erythrobacter litoralis]|uniref:Uncharacterized protein n=1 Tax=Erythrobacter litoralis TaxID=39960 RepID=A0A074MXT6_9SPHN|nr:hypothetical protein EH32_10240 [Erythrobacter litoralis]